MAQNHKSPDPKASHFQETVHVSPAQNLRHVNSSEGPRNKADLNKLSGRNFLLSEQSMNDSGNMIQEGGRHYSAQTQHKYRITTSQGHLKSAGQRSKGNVNESKMGAEGRHMDVMGIVQNIRNTSSGYEKDSCKPKYLAIDKEKLHEETLQLKRLVNSLQEENTKLRTRNTNLEKEAAKFEKMFQEASLDPKKQKQLLKAEEGNIPSLKQHIRELKTELEDKESELSSLKKKSKVTKVHELEVQLLAFQEETLRLRALADSIIAKKTDKIIQEGEKHLAQVQNAECTRLRKELEALQGQLRNYEMRNQDCQNQLANKEEKMKKEKEQFNRTIQAKERELVKLRSQLAGLTAAPTTAPANATNKKSSTNVSAEGQIRKELEKMALENHDLKVNLEEKNDHISQLERRLRDIGAKSDTKHTSSNKEFLISRQDQEPSKPVENKATAKVLQEEEVKKVITSPSYPPQLAKEEEQKKAAPAAEPKEKKVEQPQPEVKEKKVSQDDAKKIGYHINLSFRVKNVAFEAIDKLDWSKQAQNGSIHKDQLIKILENKIFGLTESEIPVLAQYLLQECNAKDGKTNDIEGLKNTLLGVIGPLPSWDEEMRKKLHSSISKICSEYRETLAEAFEMTCTGKYLSRKDLEEATKTVDITLNFAQLEYIITKLYERSHDAHKLAISDFFELFCVEKKEEKQEEKPEKPPQKDKGERGMWSKIEQKRHEPKTGGKEEGEPKESPKTKGRESQEKIQPQEQAQVKNKSPRVEEEPKQRKGSQNSRKSSGGKLDNADEIYGADSGEEDEKDEIYNDDGEDEEDEKNEKQERRKLSDEEDQDDEKYEYLFPPEEDKNNERITERGEEEEDEEENEEYKDDAEEESEPEKEKPRAKKEEVVKKEKKTKEDEYPDDAEGDSQSEKEKPKPKTKKEVVVVKKEKKTVEEEYQEDEYEEDLEEEEEEVNKNKAKSKESVRKSTDRGAVSNREETRKTSESIKSDRVGQKDKQVVSPRRDSKQSQKSAESKEVKGKDITNKKTKAVDDDYDEEFEQEFEQEFPEDDS